MQRFIEYVLHEADQGRSRGEAMEHAIVTALNGKEKPQKGIPKGAGTKVVTTLKLSGKAQVLGAEQIDVSELWSQYWPGGKVPSTTKTPKTDIMIGRKKISLKTGGAAQLMSGGKNESIATFYAAVDQLGIDPDDGGIYKKIENAILNLADRSVAAGPLKAEIAKGKDQAVKKADAAHKILMSDMNKLFASNRDFAYEFCYEAMSGDVKFGKNLGACTHFLTCGFDGENAHLVPVTNASYVNKVVKKTKVSVRFKTTSEKVGGVKTGRYKWWPVVGLVTNKLDEEIQAAGDLLTEGILSNIISKVKAFAVNLWKKVGSYIRKSWENLIDFLGLTPDVRFKNNIDFTP
jgi:hypothetical protein